MFMIIPVKDTNHGVADIIPKGEFVVVKVPLSKIEANLTVPPSNSEVEVNISPARFHNDIEDGS